MILFAHPIYHALEIPFRDAGVRGQGQLSPQFLADQLTLFQPGEADYAHLITIHCVLKWSFTRTFPGNQDATLK